MCTIMIIITCKSNIDWPMFRVFRTFFIFWRRDSKPIEIYLVCTIMIIITCRSNINWCLFNVFGIFTGKLWVNFASDDDHYRVHKTILSALSNFLKISREYNYSMGQFNYYVIIFPKFLTPPPYKIWMSLNPPPKMLT